MHYAILNSSGNALGWFEDETQARMALDAMLADAPDADLDLVASSGRTRPAEPVTHSMRSAWPGARLVWSAQTTTSTRTFGPARGTVTVWTQPFSGASGNESDERVKSRA